MIKELKTLHRKMEVERRNDATKQGQLNNSISRALGQQLDVKSAIIVDNGKKVDVASLKKDSGNNGNDDSANLGDEKSDEATEFENGDTIRDCAEIFKAVLKSAKAGVDLDCTGIIAQKFMDVEKKELYCHNIASTLIDMYHGHNPQWKKIKEAGDATIHVDYSQKEVQCEAPPFPEADTISFKDVFTQSAPRFALLTTTF